MNSTSGKSSETLSSVKKTNGKRGKTLSSAEITRGKREESFSGLKASGVKCALLKSMISVALLFVLGLSMAGCAGPTSSETDTSESDTSTTEPAADTQPQTPSSDTTSSEGAKTEEPAPSQPQATDPALDSSGFVELAEAVPDVILEPRYYSTYNFVGDRIEGYEEPVALLTAEAAEALKGASEDLEQQGYRLIIYDAYRPQTAVNDFMAWAEDPNATEMKAYFYPDEPKDTLFDKGYIAEKSGHSRGSTIDLTLFDMATGKPVDMGGTFDFFGEISHPDATEGLTEEQIANRRILADAMIANGFNPLDTEWWHFTLADEPYPDTYFDFPVASLD